MSTLQSCERAHAGGGTQAAVAKVLDSRALEWSAVVVSRRRSRSHAARTFPVPVSKAFASVSQVSS